MSFGLHRLWKHPTIQVSDVRGRPRARRGGRHRRPSLAFAKVGRSGQVWLTDINHAMLARGRDRMIDHGSRCRLRSANGEAAFRTIGSTASPRAFGPRNMTH